MAQVTIESVAVKLLKSGKSAKETLEAVKRVFPQAQTSLKCIYFYSSKHKLGLQRGAVVDAKALEELMATLGPNPTVATKAPGPDKLDEAVEAAVDKVNAKQLVRKVG